MFLSMAKQRSGCFICPCYCPLAHALSIYDKSRRSGKFTADRRLAAMSPQDSVIAIALGPEDKRIMGTLSRGLFSNLSTWTYNVERKSLGVIYN